MWMSQYTLELSVSVADHGYHQQRECDKCPAQRLPGSHGVSSGSWRTENVSAQVLLPHTVQEQIHPSHFFISLFHIVTASNGHTPCFQRQCPSPKEETEKSLGLIARHFLKILLRVYIFVNECQDQFEVLRKKSYYSYLREDLIVMEQHYCLNETHCNYYNSMISFCRVSSLCKWFFCTQTIKINIPSSCS